MNQGNAGQFAADDGVFQDGGVLGALPGPAGMDRDLS
jgi:uncharacterized protein YukJ